MIDSVSVFGCGGFGGGIGGTGGGIGGRAMKGWTPPFTLTSHCASWKSSVA